MSDLDALEAVFKKGTAASQPSLAVPPETAEACHGDVTDRDERRLKSLVGAERGKYQRCLDAEHDYPSDSEASMAVVDAMVVRHFTDAEIWRTLTGSKIHTLRVERKGASHARKLYVQEIAKARQKVTPFAEDPGEPGGVYVQRATPAKGGEPPAVVAPEELPAERQPPPPLSMPTGNDFVSRYVRHAAQRTDAPLEAHELMAVLTLSALAGPQVRIPIATARSGWSLCLWGMYVVNSTVGRKTTVVNLAKEILGPILGRAVIEWEGSPQGVIQRLMETDGQPAAFTRDEYSGLMQQMNRGGHMAGMLQTLIRAYDGGVIENVRTKKQTTKDGPKQEDADRVELPYLATVAAATWDSFMERCTIDNVLDGFLARFIFVTGSAVPRRPSRITANMEAEFEDLVEGARQFRARCAELHQVEIDDDVLDAFWEIQESWVAEAKEISRPDAAAAALQRLTESVLKTAALLAIDGTPIYRAPVITMEYFERARAMGERWKSSLLKVIHELGSTHFMRQAEAVLQSVLSRRSGVAVRDLMRTHRSLKVRDLDEILEVLQTREQVEVIQIPAKRGRPPQIVFPYGHVPGASDG